MCKIKPSNCEVTALPYSGYNSNFDISKYVLVFASTTQKPCNYCDTVYHCIILTINSDYFFVRHSNAKWLLCELYGCRGSTMNNTVLRDVLGPQPGSFETLKIYNTLHGTTPQKTALEYSGYFIQKFRLVSACCGVVQC